MKKIVVALLCVGLISSVSLSQKKKDKNKAEDKLITSGTVSAFKIRNVGPAINSGRIADIAVHPTQHDTWIIATAAGGVWKTENHGITFKPVFDGQNSFSTACVAYAPSNPNTVWVGSGENNNQRSASYGDGVYKSLDGGNSFKNMGLKTSEHIGNIIIHPTNENIVWVAAYGPLWKKGGERGVYKTTDGGETWKQTLEISENTGISEIAIDPTNPNTLYAAAHQRRRHVYTYIGGGPESGIYKSTDGGETWKEINNGLPAGNMGRIGIAVSPADNNVVYAIVEAKNGKHGFYKSTNRGESWSKQSDYKTSGNYYQEIVCDPYDVNKVFSLSTYLHHTIDGGKTFNRTGEHKKHVDNHAIWIDPNNTDHFIVGCDGGLYETYTHAKEWRYFPNLPITQFYKVATDNDYPFYNIYGGTQDNNSMGGPSATLNSEGIVNADWFITNGGDGFESQIDPKDPNIAYAQAQYGWLVRFDKKSGERLNIQPSPGKGEAAYRWNWDAPLLISPHDNKTLYFAANKLFKSTDRGNSWQTISDDLTQQIDRNKLPVMGQVWSKDAVMKNGSTTIYGNIVAFDESPKKKGLLYVGTDDGLIQVSENDGTTWRKMATFNGVPKDTYVNMLVASPTDENIVYAVFNNHKRGDFKPYIYVSKDKGNTWINISGDLPEAGSVYCLRQDHINQNLLFAGTEYGVFFSLDAGKTWAQLKAGIPTIAIRDLDIQKRENDLVMASFGRGFFVLDNYAPLRSLTKENLDKKAFIFPIKEAKSYILNGRGTGYEGASYYKAKNPDFGATFYIHIKDVAKSLKSIRQEKEKEQEKNKEAVSFPSLEAVRAENNEEAARLIWKIRNQAGKEINRIISTPKKGISKMVWNLRMEGTNPVTKGGTKGTYSNNDGGILVTPGYYSVEVYLEKEGEVEQIVGKTNFKVSALGLKSIPNPNIKANENFANKMNELNREFTGATAILNENAKKLNALKQVIIQYPNADLKLLKEVKNINDRIKLLNIKLNGDKVKSSLNMEVLPSLSQRLGYTAWYASRITAQITETHKMNIQIVEDEYKIIRPVINQIVFDTKALEEKLKAIKAPYTRGGDQDWKQD